VAAAGRAGATTIKSQIRGQLRNSDAQAAGESPVTESHVVRSTKSLHKEEEKTEPAAKRREGGKSSAVLKK